MKHSTIVCHISEVEKPGDFVVLPWKVDGEIAVSNIDGEIVGWDNRCPHRGMRIYTTMSGNARPVCGYHHRCATPDLMRVKYPIGHVNGWVVANEEGDTSEREMGFFSLMPALRLHSTLAYTYDCPWDVAIENFLDSEHVSHVHGTSLSTLRIVSSGQTHLDDGSSVETFESALWERLDKMAKRFPEVKEFGEQGVDYVHHHFFPYTALSSTRGWTWSLQHYFPRKDGRTNFIHRMYVTDAPGMESFFNSAARMNEKVFREDAEIVKHVPDTTYAPLERHEGRLNHFRLARMRHFNE